MGRHDEVGGDSGCRGPMDGGLVMAGDRAALRHG